MDLEFVGLLFIGGVACFSALFQLVHLIRERRRRLKAKYLPQAWCDALSDSNPSPSCCLDTHIPTKPNTVFRHLPLPSSERDYAYLPESSHGLTFTPPTPAPPRLFDQCASCGAPPPPSYEHEYSFLPITKPLGATGTSEPLLTRDTFSSQHKHSHLPYKTMSPLCGPPPPRSSEHDIGSLFRSDRSNSVSCNMMRTKDPLPKYFHGPAVQDQHVSSTDPFMWDPLTRSSMYPHLPEISFLRDNVAGPFWSGNLPSSFKAVGCDPAAAKMSFSFVPMDKRNVIDSPSSEVLSAVEAHGKAEADAKNKSERNGGACSNSMTGVSTGVEVGTGCPSPIVSFFMALEKEKDASFDKRASCGAPPPPSYEHEYSYLPKPLAPTGTSEPLLTRDTFSSQHKNSHLPYKTMSPLCGPPPPRSSEHDIGSLFSSDRSNSVSCNRAAARKVRYSLAPMDKRNVIDSPSGEVLSAVQAHGKAEADAKNKSECNAGSCTSMRDDSTGVEVGTGSVVPAVS